DYYCLSYDRSLSAGLF
nr:immunoglobulin light chain junction region [Macaca mulatta]